MTTNTTSTTNNDTDPILVLPPSYRVPIGLGVMAGLLGLLTPWLGGFVALFGGFLAFQAATLRLHFTSDALEIYRGERQLRQFPYCDWENWQIFWAPVPILFYFKEVNSIHFLPILFSPDQLRSRLEKLDLVG